MMMITTTTEATHAPEDASSDAAEIEPSDAPSMEGRQPQEATMRPTTQQEKKKEARLGFRCIFKRITKHLTLTNIVCLYTLSGLFTGGGGDDANANTTTVQPSFQQHFVWEPLGYVPSVLVTPIERVAPASTPKSSAARRYAGYYSKDKIAMKTALLSIPPRPKKDNKQNQEETQTSPTSSETKNNTFSYIDLALEEEFKETCTDNDDAPTRTKTPPKTTTLPGQSSTPSRFQTALASAVVVLDLTLGINPTKEITFVRSAVTFLIGVTKESKSSLEVLIRLQSDGGQVESYGLLAEQFRRLRQDPNITLTIACDVAALSGGYLVASLASPGQLLASPFASIGSIGVVNSAAGGLNFRDALEAYGIREVRVKSGEKKATGGGLSGMTDQEIRFEQARTDATHRAFRDHVRRWRGDAIDDIDFVASGDHWLGVDALGYGLVDKLITSDEYLDGKMQEGYNVLRLKENNVGKKGSGLLGGDTGDSSWFWILFDLIFPRQEADNQAAMVAATEERRASVSLAANLIREVFRGA